MIQSVSDTYMLKDGRAIPGIGFGLWDRTFSQDIYTQVRTALDAGYRHIDAASWYRNEEAAGRAVKDSGIDRDDIFITTKLWPTEFPHAEEAFEASLRKLGLDHVDLYLVHWPGTDEHLLLATWEKLIRWREEGKALSIGGANFLPKHMDSVEQHTGVPVANDQIELHPWHRQPEVKLYCDSKGIPVTAWGPILHGHLKEEPLLRDLGEKYSRSAAQVTLRWHIQHGNVIIPKSSQKERIEENIRLFDFSLDDEDMARIDALDGKGRFGSDPLTFNG